MKHLRISYMPELGGPELTLFDGPVEEMTFTDSPGQIAVTGRFGKPAKTAGVADLLAGIAANRKAQTANDVVRRRNQMMAEKDSDSDD